MAKLPRGYKRRVFKLLRERLPRKAKVLLLSFTGGRAFGWGSERHDVDVRGVILIDKPYWDFAHIGKEHVDLMVETLEHLGMQIYYRHWTVFENMSNPFYIHSAFDFEKFMSFCGADCVKNHLTSIESEILRFKYVHRSPRAGLHCYRLVMVPLYYLDTGKIEIDCVKLNREVFHFEEFDKMVEAYKYDRQVKIDYEKAIKDYEEMLSELKDRIRDVTNQLDNEKLARWIEETKQQIRKKL